MPDDSRNETRPSPDALLEHAEREERGRLRIFLGAAPGVGKTYEMLMAGRARLADGIDVVIGIVETHGRKETQALVEGYEVIPRQKVDYKGRILDEMDLDAILARRPALVLVDELAHTNAPGSRHPKRYLDVQEILTHGIDVYTTLNIQHVESLNDVVAQITRVRVRETVPDSIIDQADDIEIIDLTPDDLIKRLEEGKVYFPNTAQRAVENYFSPGNLTALRELALRRTAQRVDEQLLNHMQAHAIPGPWAAGERVLVCVDARPGGASRIRYARRLADRLRAPWTALHVDTPRSAAMSEEDKDRLATLLRLAEQLGAEVTTIPGQNVAQDIVRHATANNFTHIVVGRPTRSRWRELIEGSLTYDLIRNAGDISVHVISGTERSTEATSRNVKAATEQTPFQVWPYLLATAYVAGSLAFSAVLDQFLDVRNLAIIFLMAVLTSAVTCGLWPALYACLVSALAFNYFFLEPRYTLTIRDPESIVALARLPRRCRHRQQSDGARAASGGRRPLPGTSHGGYLSLFKEARRRRHARRRSLGHRLPDRLDAEAARRAASARKRLDHRQGRLSARRHAGRGRHRSRPLGLGAQPRRGTRRRHASRRKTPLSPVADRTHGCRRRRPRQ